MYLNVTVDSTSQRIPVFIRDSESPNGAGLTGLAWNTSGLLWTYWREDQGNAGGTAVTLASATRGTFTSGGFKEKDSSLLPGWYELGIPNAAVATGSAWVRMQLRGASGMVLADFVLALAPSLVVTGSIAAGVSAGVSFTAKVTSSVSIAAGVSVDATPSAGLAAQNAIALGVSAATTPAASISATSAIAIAADLDLAPSSNVAITLSIELDVGGLDVGFRRFIDEDLALHVGAGFSVVPGLGGNHPEVFTPASELGTPSGFKPATEPGTPSGFKPASESGTPGIFKP